MKPKPIPTALVAAFLAVEGVLYVSFLAMDLLGMSQHTIWLKYSGVILCALFSALCAARTDDWFLVQALVFTVCADWFLLVRGENLLTGVLLFWVAQMAYAARLLRARVPLRPWLRLGLLALAELALFLTGMMISLLNAAAGVYFSMLVSNTILAWTLSGRRWRCFSIGLTLFIGCDICVGLFNSGLLSGTPYRLVSFGMWLFYLPSQVLIALSGLPEKEVPHETE